MRIAVTNENNNVFQQFSLCKSFAIFETENDEITSKTILDTGGKVHSGLATLLSGNNIDIIICGRIGCGDKEALSRCGIELVAGATGNIDEVIKAYINGFLVHSEEFAGEMKEHYAENSCKKQIC